MAQRFTLAFPHPSTGQDVNASALNPFPVSTIVNPSNSSTVTSVEDSSASVQLLASNVNRKGAVITNTSSAILYIRLGSQNASQTMFTYRLAQNDTQEIGFGYIGPINGAWATDPNDGAAIVTELLG